MADTTRYQSRLLNLKGTPFYSCIDHYWTLFISLKKTERVILRAPDGVETDHPDPPLYNPARSSFLVPVSALQGGTLSWQHHLELILTSFEVPLQQTLDFASQIMSYARAMASLSQGQGQFSVEADLALVIARVFLDEPRYTEDLVEFWLDYELDDLGASSDAISRLVEQGFSTTARGQKGNCMICLDDMAGDGKLARMPCEHVFHSHCIVRWLETSNSCPICRYRLEENT